MGCASSTPMIQTTGSEMLKAATHVASDATKTAEDAVEGVKNSVGKTLETAKDSMTTTVEGVKHEVENVVKEKSEMLEDAKNTLMEKLHLKQTEGIGNDDMEDVKENIGKTETDKLKTQLNDGTTTAMASSRMEESAAIKKDIKGHILARTDTETDSMKTSTPEPEIEQALAKSHHNQEDDDDDNPPTPKPTLLELENLTAEALKQQQQELPSTSTMVNDMNLGNNPSISGMHENIKTLDNNKMMSLIVDNKSSSKDNEPTILGTVATTNTDIKSNTMHKTPQIPTAVQTKPPPTRSQFRNQPPLQLQPTTLVKTVSTSQPRLGKENLNTKLQQTSAAAKQSFQQPVFSAPAPPPLLPRQQQTVAGKTMKPKANKKEDKVIKNSQTEEKRPGTTEWEKFADMLAQVRKFNPHDALKRGGTFTKFGGALGMPRPSFVGHHMRGGVEDDASDSTSNFRGSPFNSQHSSARASGRVQRITSRPTTGNNSNNRKIDGDGGRFVNRVQRDSNAASTLGRKFDFNPTRSRLSEIGKSVSSNSLLATSLQNTVTTLIPFALTNYSPNSYESVKSPANMRSHHSLSDARYLPPLESVERTRSHNQRQHLRHDYNHNGSSMPVQSDLYSNDSSTLTSESSNTSLFSNCSNMDNVNTYKSSTLDVRPLSTNPPVKNTSSFLTIPRNSPFNITKSYTDLYFSATSNKENRPQVMTTSEMRTRDNSPYKVRTRCYVCCQKYAIK